jgi:uncharacterized repeat protein (TIGR03803 family)
MNQFSVRKTIVFLGFFCAVVAMAAALTFAASGDFFKKKVNFDYTNGAVPVSPLVTAIDGNFYGITAEGGAIGAGTVFKLGPGDTLTTLYSFCSEPNCTDGEEPGRLIQASDGNFYGTTYGGGANDDGTVFQLSPAGTLTRLYSFCSEPNCTDGDEPVGLIQASDGNFYGTTYEGGATDDGTVFQLSPAGTLTTLHSFCSQPNCTDGWSANGLIQASDGNIYGTTYFGATYDGIHTRPGTVFQLSPAGTLTTLYSFHGTDGAHPDGGLIQVPNGNFWGTTEGGSGGYGTVFVLGVGLAPFVETFPTSGTVETPITILGPEMTGATSVTFNGTPATFQVVSGHTIKTTVPSGATTGPVTVTTPSRTLTSNVNFQVN